MPNLEGDRLVGERLGVDAARGTLVVLVGLAKISFGWIAEFTALKAGAIFCAVGGACVVEDGGWFSASDCCGLLVLRGVE